MACTHWRSLAGFAVQFRRMEQRFPAVSPLGKVWCFPPDFQGLVRRAGFRIRPHRWNDRQRASESERRKRGTLNQAIGRSKGGLTTKILALVDALGNLVRFSLWPGQRHDSVGALDLIDGLTFEALLGDKAFDNNTIREDLDRRGAEAVIPSKADRKQAIPHDKDKYRWRHLIENYFSKIKEFRSVNTRYDKTDLSYKATISLAAIMIALR